MAQGLMANSGQFRVPVKRTAAVTVPGLWLELACVGRVVLLHHAGRDTPALTALALSSSGQMRCAVLSGGKVTER